MTTATPLRPAPAALPTPDSLQAAALQARQQGQPLVVMTTLEGCPYCNLVRNHYLLPMLKAGEIAAVQTDVRDTRRNLRGFDGELTSPSEQARAWKARFTPTVMFFNAAGEELAERLVGVAVPDFYGSYLEARLIEARAKLK
jgi:thioredoxin-related protein